MITAHPVDDSLNWWNGNFERVPFTAVTVPRSRSLDNRYRLIEPLGQGGMGRVWLGYDEMLHRQVAVKEIVTPPRITEDERTRVRERSMREARSIARLDHVNVVRIFDIVIADGDPWIVMEYVPAQSLRTLLERNGRVSPRRGAEVGLAVLHALGEAHGAGVVHRDVKPDNILLGRDGRIVLTDFGLAAVDADNPRLTNTGAFVGTPSYLAPERLQEGNADPGTDLWSLGVTLYTAVEGRTPYERASSLATLTAVLMEPPPATHHAGPLAPVIEGLMRKDPAERIDAGTAGELLRMVLDPPGASTVAAPSAANAARHARPAAGNRPMSPPPAGRQVTVEPTMAAATATATAATAAATATAAAAATRATGRHHLRLPGRRLGARITAVAATTLVVLVGADWVIGAAAGEADCTADDTVHVAAAPEIAPVIQAVMASDRKASRGVRCVEVTPVDPMAIAQLLATEGNGSLNGLGPPSAEIARPDVWIPDSSTWLARVRTVDADLIPATGPSLASSPVVVAVPQPLAGRFGSPLTTLTWSDLVQDLITGEGVQAGTVDPVRDAPALSALMAVESLASGTDAKARTASIAGIRALAAHASSVRADMLARFPSSDDPATLGASLAAAPVTEQAVISYNATKPPVPLIPLFVDPAPATMDYPFVVLPHARPGITPLPDQLLARLRGAGFDRALAEKGLRRGGSANRGLRSAGDQVDRALSTWGVVTKPGRMLALLDVSGSMSKPVPTAGGKSREQVTVAAAATGLGLLGDDWSVGLWTFSTHLSGTVPYREFAPIRLVANQRQLLNHALSTVTPTRGDTGLYDTILAAYKEVQNGWEPSKSNTVVVMTDGRNENPGGLTLDELTAELRRATDPRRRIQVIAIGIGEASSVELTAVTDVTGGGVFLARDPSQIGSIFLQALALRPGR